MTFDQVPRHLEDGPDPDRRRGDSIRALATPAERAAAEACVAPQDATRPAAGQFSCFVAVKR